MRRNGRIVPYGIKVKQRYLKVLSCLGHTTRDRHAITVCVSPNEERPWACELPAACSLLSYACALSNSRARSRYYLAYSASAAATAMKAPVTTAGLTSLVLAGALVTAFLGGAFFATAFFAAAFFFCCSSAAFFFCALKRVEPVSALNVLRRFLARARVLVEPVSSLNLFKRFFASARVLVEPVSFLNLSSRFCAADLYTG